MQKRHDDTRVRDSGESRWGQELRSTPLGEHGGASGVSDRFPNPGLSRPALLPCTKMSVSGATQVARKFSTWFSRIFSFITIEIYIHMYIVVCHVSCFYREDNGRMFRYPLSPPQNSLVHLSNVYKVFSICLVKARERCECTSIFIPLNGHVSNITRRKMQGCERFGQNYIYTYRLYCICETTPQ